MANQDKSDTIKHQHKIELQKFAPETNRVEGPKFNDLNL